MKIFSPISPFFDIPSSLEGKKVSHVDIRPGEDWLIWPDSCWILSNRPVFIPDFDEYFIGVPALAGKIGRLGKTIAPKFARRYIGSLSAAIIILSKNVEKTLEAGNIPAGSSICFDNSIILGDWVDIDNNEIPEKPLTLRLEEFFIPDIDKEDRDAPWYDFEIKIAPESLFSTIVETSRRHTLKMGDIILHPLVNYSIDLRENENIRISIPELSPTPILTTKFK
ncbi:MAG: hypothetical protein K2M31_03150 [Muribaculaceae bacterium]|nr:hypothetical protein [Muribaculaceae bacterium]